jgi:hypothetical protein
MVPDNPDPRLQRLYEQALARRVGAAPDIPVETVHALAAGTFAGSDRLTLLDEVLGHPALAAEFDFFAAMEREAGTRSRGPLRRGSPVLALAASVALLIGAGLAWRAMRPGDDVPRGTADVLVTQTPVEGTVIGAGSAFAWRPSSGAVSYRVRIIDAGGAEVFSGETRDTLLTLPPEALLPSAANVTWWVAATFPDGRTVRSLSVTIRTEPR